MIPLSTEGGRLAWQTEEQFKWKKEAMRKIVMVGGKQKKSQTHCNCLLHETREQGMAAMGSNSPCQLGEGKLRHRRINNLIDSAVVR